MLRFLADEDFDNRIVRGLLRRLPDLDIVRVQDTEIFSAGDGTVLQWAAAESRVLLSHDVNTMTYHFAERMRAGQTSTGIIFVAQSLQIGAVVDDLTLIAQYSLEGEYQNRVIFLPLI